MQEVNIFYIEYVRECDKKSMDTFWPFIGLSWVVEFMTDCMGRPPSIIKYVCELHTQIKNAKQYESKWNI